jgi:hypothetical protein
MQVTYTLPVDSINEDFLESIKTRFAGKDVKISIEEIRTNQTENQMETFQRMEKLRKKLSTIKVDPDLDLSALANEVNL